MITILTTGLNYYGLTERPGPGSNPKLLELIQSEIPSVTDDSRIAWCALFITHLFRHNGLDYLIPDRPYMARSWLNFGYEILNDQAQPGDLVIFWRGSREGWKGHIGLFINWAEDGRVRILGGNQSNGVNIRLMNQDRILGIRSELLL